MTTVYMDLTFMLTKESLFADGLVANLIISLCRTKSKILQDLGPFQLHFAGHL